jgi:hypothetical protein
MSTSPVIYALRNKRSELSGEIKELERRLKDRRTTLAHLDETIRMFDPDMDPAKIPTKRPYVRGGYFKAGEVSRRVQEYLRGCPKPVPASLIAAEIMRAKGLPMDTPALRRSVKNMVGVVLRSFAKRGVVTKLGGSKDATWAVSQRGTEWASTSSSPG